MVIGAIVAAPDVLSGLELDSQASLCLFQNWPKKAFFRGYSFSAYYDRWIL